MFEVRPNRPEEGLRIVSIWRAAVIATHEFLSTEDRNEIELEAEALSAVGGALGAVDLQYLWAWSG